jgi:hypothetical protein
VQPAYIETVRIFNVNIDDWSVDCISEHGVKRYFDIQVMSPYFHFMNGEGIYVMPEIGALAWLCILSTGKMAPAFLLGYQAPFDETDKSYRAGRQNLNPGDIMMRTRDENFIILRRGGVIQIGATPIAQRMYVPLRNFIQDFCENYKLSTFGGEMFWETLRDDQTTDGTAPTKFSLKAKSKANDEEHIATLTMGSHGEVDPLTMELTVWTDGTKDREARVQLQITNEGDVTWNIEKDWTQNIAGKYTVAAGDDATIETQGKAAVTAQGDAALESVGGNLSMSAGVNADMTAGVVATVDAPVIKMGGNALSQAVKGTELFTVLSAFANAQAQVATGPLAPLKPGYQALGAALATILSAKVKVE